LADRCRSEGIEFANVELAGYIDYYRTLFADGEKRFENRVLFPGRDFDSIPYAAMWGSLSTCLGDLKPDVVFTYGYSCRIMRRVMAWAKENHIAVGLISDSNRFDQKRRRPVEFLKSLYVSRYDAAFVGGTSSSLYLQGLGLPGERILPGYDVVDNESFRTKAQAARQARPALQKKWNLAEKSFLFAGRLGPPKNLTGLIRAYRLYAESLDGLDPWGLSICGTGPLAEELQSLVRGLPAGLARHIVFLGQTGQSDLAEVYSASSCLVLPSLTESWGLVVNEALASALPVLVSERCGCAADLVRDGINGWRFDPASDQELAGLMSRLSGLDPGKLEEMGRCGEDLISEWGLDRFVGNGLGAVRLAYQHNLKRPSKTAGREGKADGG
jgi:glycosyltransferase involved in cell wall biosynthesis